MANKAKLLSPKLSEIMRERRPDGVEDETERRFVVERLPFGLGPFSDTKLELVQFYLSFLSAGEKETKVRVRSEDPLGRGEIVYRVTRKIDPEPEETDRFTYLYLPDGRSVRIERREEEWWKITDSEFREVRDGFYWPRVEKDRYMLPIKGSRLTAQFDLFKGLEMTEIVGARTPLMIAEVEFSGGITQAREFEPPAWFGPEITGIAELTNRKLATKGVPVKVLKSLLRPGEAAKPKGLQMEAA